MHLSTLAEAIAVVKQRRFSLPRLFTALLSLTVGVALVFAVRDLPEDATDLRPPVEPNLDQSQVTQPVTAVLLNFRGYDTWLEIGVLVLAVLGILTLRQSHFAPATSESEPTDPVLLWLARLLVPFMVLTGGYLLWLGTHAPGGAFQAGAVLGAAGVLLRLTGYRLSFALGGWSLRVLALVGFIAFLLLAVGTLLSGRAFLQYPTSWAGTLILLIEAAVTISIGFTLALLFVGTTPRKRGSE